MPDLNYRSFTNHCRIDGFSYCPVRIAQSDQTTAITRLIAVYPNHYDAAALVCYLDKLRQAVTNLTGHEPEGNQVMLIVARRAAKTNGWLAAGESLFPTGELLSNPYPIWTAYETVRSAWLSSGYFGRLPLKLKEIDGLVADITRLVTISLSKAAAEFYLKGINALPSAAELSELTLTGGAQ